MIDTATASEDGCKPRAVDHQQALQQPTELSCFAEMQKSRVEPRS
jgi:hypothetical protein